MKTNNSDVRSIAIEDIATVFADFFVKENMSGTCYKDKWNKMSYQRRKSVVEKTLNKIETVLSPSGV
jgi:hypothetical protein